MVNFELEFILSSKHNSSGKSKTGLLIEIFNLINAVNLTREPLVKIC